MNRSEKIKHELKALIEATRIKHTDRFFDDYDHFELKEVIVTALEEIAEEMREEAEIQIQIEKNKRLLDEIDTNIALGGAVI